MIVGSLLLVVVAVALLVFGLKQGSNTYLIGSVAASMFAAVSLIVGGRQVAEAEAEAEAEAQASTEEPVARDRAVEAERAEELVPAGGPSAAAATQQEALAQAGAPVQRAEPVQPEMDEYESEDPPDEPPPQPVSPGDAALLAGMTDEVLVVDGRPRYHRSGCSHLLGLQSEPLAVGDAVRLGFSPCSRCRPDSALLDRARPA